MMKLIDTVIDAVFAFPAWLRAGRTDWKKQHQRRLTPRYLFQKRKVKTLWVIAGIGMVLYPEIYFVAIVMLFTAFLSFSMLDHS